MRALPDRAVVVLDETSCELLSAETATVEPDGSFEGNVDVDGLRAFRVQVIATGVTVDELTCTGECVDTTGGSASAISNAILVLVD